MADGERGRIIETGSVRIERHPDGSIAVWWPGWIIECPYPVAGLRIDRGCEVGPQLEGKPLMLGCGSGPHLSLSNDKGKAEQMLASLRVGGYSIYELMAAASPE